jgi:hypothetical protein
MKKKHSLLTALFFLLLFGIYLGHPKNVLAANPSQVTLKVNTTYKSYDITGDKKKDTILIRVSKKDSRSDVYNSLSVIVNNKTVYSFKNTWFYDVYIKLYTLTNGKTFLYLYAIENNWDGPVCGIFQYKSGKLSQVVNFQTLFKKYGIHNYGNVTSIKGNTLTTKYYSMSWVLGPCYMSYTYTYKNGTLQRTSAVTTFSTIYSYGKNTRTFYANRTLVVYSTVNTTKRAFSVPKGAAVTVDKCYMAGGNMYVRVKYKGKYGWLKACTSYSQQQFSNATYAG